jgi:hypothetical protein
MRLVYWVLAVPRRLRLMAAALSFALFGAALGFAGAASAAVTISSDPLNGAQSGVQAGLQAFIEQNLVPIIVVFLVIGVAMSLLIGYIKKSGQVAKPR